MRIDSTTVAAAAALEGKHARSFVNVPVLEDGRLVALLFVNDDGPRHWTKDEIEFIQEAAARTRTAVERASAEVVLRASEEELRRLNAELGEAGRMKDEFIATLAHELRNPLAPLRTALELQRIAGHDSKLIAQTRTLMERQVAHMVRLIDDLLDLSRVSRGLIDLKIERVSLAAALAPAFDASRPLIEKFSHELTVKLPEEELIVCADPVRIAQIITNLLNNAAKFTPAGGKLSLTLERDGDNALIRVRDSGIGIDSVMIERVFNMFEQVDRSFAQVSGGLGIGLTLVRRLVEALGGTVRAESAGLGSGSEFTVSLPLAPGASQPLPLKPHGSTQAPFAALQRILIADDNEDAARSLAMLLELNGHETRVAVNGAQAVAMASEFEPHVAILDIAMPLLDGFGAARALRASPLGQKIFLIALSGFGQVNDMERSKDAGLDHHLVKPVDFEQIEALLKANPRQHA